MSTTRHAGKPTAKRTDIDQGPTSSERGKQLYHQWLMAGGNVDNLAFTYRPWEKLSQGEQRRWIWISRGGYIAHNHHHEGEIPPEGTEITEKINFLDYDEAQLLAGRTAGGQKLTGIPDDFTVIPDEFPTYDEWVRFTFPKIREHPWQFWRPRIQVTHDDYRAQLKQIMDQQYAWEHSTGRPVEKL